jgi:hypothetical protein
MKLLAARAEIDADDIIILLYRKLGFTTVDEGLELVEQAYPGAAGPGEGEIPPHRNRGLDAALKSPPRARRRGPDVCVTTARYVAITTGVSRLKGGGLSSLSRTS